MSRFAILTSAVLFSLSGCTVPNSNPLDVLSRESIAEVASFATEVKNFLYSGKSEDEAIEKGKQALVERMGPVIPS